MMNLLKAITNYFFPAKFTGDDETKRKHIVLIWLGLIIGLNYIISFSLISSFTAPWVVMMGIAGALLNIIGPFLLRKGLSFFWACQWILGSNIMCYACMVYIIGDTSSVTIVWMCGFPLFALILMGTRQSVMWGFISCSTTVGLIVLQLNGYMSMPQEFRAHLPVMSFMMVLFFLIPVVTLYYIVEQTKNRLFNQLEAEKQKSEDLLLNILPPEVAAELKEKGGIQARLFDHVTVLFTDFVGFTSASEKLSPQQLVDELHACFKAFDEICHRYNIEKIKTVGDAYLAVSGLPVAAPNHAGNIVRAAQDIRDFMQQRKVQNPNNTFEVRIGIHSGTVVAGIVGVKKYAYDIWGDAVNTAARMEQNSEAGKINISESTYNIVSSKFNCTYRGEIEAKNKGKLKMYFVE